MNYLKLVTAGLVLSGVAVLASIESPDRFLPLERTLRNEGVGKYKEMESNFSSDLLQVKSAPEDGREYTTVLEEDFSKMTAGSEEMPDGTVISAEGNVIPSQYTKVPGWGGRSIMQAGGMAFIGIYTDPYTGSTMTGQIELPELDLHRDNGTAYLTFRARLMDPTAYDMVTIRWVDESDGGIPVTGSEQTMSINGWQWSTVNVTLTDCPSHAIIQIYANVCEMLIDDIKVEQFKPEIEAPTALKWTDFTYDSFTANWSEVPNADHYIFNCYYVRREGTEDQLPDYKYVAKDVITKETSYHLSNLKRDKVYYYYVRAVSESGVKSEESKLVEVMDLMKPDGIEISNVTKDGFKVKWDPVYKAEGYGFQAIVDHTAQKDEDYALLDEPFDNVISEGKIGEPYINPVGYYDMDSYGMTRANWVLYEGGIINGALALHNYTGSLGTEYFGELLSPLMTISQTTGEVTIEGDFATLDGVKPYIQLAVPVTIDGETRWGLGAGGEVNQTIGNDWTHVKVNYKVKPGLIRFSIGCTDGGWLYMDNLKISVKLPSGKTQRVLYRYDEIKEGLEVPVYYCDTPDRLKGDEYSFALMAAMRHPASGWFPRYVTSEWTDIYKVPSVADSGVEITEARCSEANFKAYGTSGKIIISNPDGEALTVIDATGHTVARTPAENSEVCAAPGIYVVASANGGAVKVIVK